MKLRELEARIRETMRAEGCDKLTKESRERITEQISQSMKDIKA